MADIDEIYARLLAAGYQSQLFSEVENQRPASGGRETVGTCPFCGKAKHFYFSSEKAVYNCFSCQKSGDWLNYMEEHQRLDFRQALEILADAAGVELAGHDRQAWQKRQRRSSVIEAAQELFVQELEEASTPEAEAVARYLEERGYTPDEIKSMELGAYVGGQERLKQRLEERGYTAQEISESGLLTSGFGTSHTLSMLWRDPAGRAIGLVCRALHGADRKYMYSAGMEKSKGLIGLTRCRGAETVLLVEGVLDALYLSAKGEQVVAVGGTSLSTAQIAALEHNETKQIVLCLDTDSSGQQATAKILQALRSSSLRAYVATLPAGVKDPDELVRKRGMEPLTEALAAAESGSRWLARWIVEQHDLQTDRGRDRALEQAFAQYQELEDRLEQKAFLDSLQAATGLSPEEIGPRLQTHAERASQRRTGQLLQAAIHRLHAKANEGDLIGAEEELAQSLQELRRSRGVQAPEPYSLTEFERDILTAGEGLSTGYQALDKHCLVPQGAITIVAGRPGHGKTTLKLNMLLRMLKRYEDKAFFFFSYEESRRALAVKLIMAMAGVELHEAHNVRAYVNYLKERRDTEPEPAIEAALERYEELTSSGRLWLVDSRLTAEDLAATIGHLASGREIGAVFVDYIQKIGLQRPADVRYLEIKRVSELLLEQAVSCDLPIILGAQLGRGGRGERVRLDNLRESGDIENDANLVIGLYNDTEDKRQQDTQSQAERPQEIALELTVLKNRNGAAGGRAMLSLHGRTYQIKESNSPY